MRKLLIAAALVALAAMTANPAQAGEHRLGFGFHYWKTVDELADQGFGDIEDDGLSQVFSYQYLPGGFLRFEFDVEYFDKGFGGSTTRAYSPQFYVLVGRGIYAGVGVGATYSSGLADDWSDPYYAARAGVDLLMLPKFHLDINANYRFNAWDQLDEVDTETLTLGAIARFTF